MSAAPFSKPDLKQSGFHWRPLLATLFYHSVLILFTVIIVYPVVWMIMASFKTPGELISNIWGLPAEPAYQNYADAWEKVVAPLRPGGKLCWPPASTLPTNACEKSVPQPKLPPFAPLLNWTRAGRIEINKRGRSIESLGH